MRFSPRKDKHAESHKAGAESRLNTITQQQRHMEAPPPTPQAWTETLTTFSGLSSEHLDSGAAAAAAAAESVQTLKGTF